MIFHVACWFRCSAVSVKKLSTCIVLEDLTKKLKSCVKRIVLHRKQDSVSYFLSLSTLRRRTENMSLFAASSNFELKSTRLQLDVLMNHSIFELMCNFDLLLLLTKRIKDERAAAQCSCTDAEGSIYL